MVLDRAVHIAVTRSLRQRNILNHSFGVGDCIMEGRNQTAQMGLPLDGRARPLAAARTHAPSAPIVDVTEEDLMEALRGSFVPAAFWTLSKGGQGGGTGRGVNGVEGWHDVGGLSEVRAALREALELPFRFSALVAGAPLRLRTGLLLYGPPGCGTTHIVAAAAAAMASPEEGGVSMR